LPPTRTAADAAFGAQTRNSTRSSSNGIAPRVCTGARLPVRRLGDTRCVIREELALLTTWEDRHRRLIARLLLALLATLAVDALGSVAIYFSERHAAQTDISSFGDALFFTTVQLLTVSSQLRNPLTTAGRVIDVALEIWAVIVVAGSAGAMASFFQSGDS
jgi:hypothetical protein